MKNLFLILIASILLIGCMPEAGQTWEHKASNGEEGKIEILETKENWVKFKSLKNNVVVEMPISEFAETYQNTCGCGSSNEETNPNPFRDNTNVENEKEYETSDNIEVL